MRLFVQVRPDEAAVADLRAHLGQVRTTDPSRWHLTLAFLGDAAPPAGLDEVARRHAAFSLRLAGGGSFGPRTPWVGVSGDVVALHALAADVRRAYGLGDEPYVPHLTLRGVPVPLLEAYEGPPFAVRELQLVQTSRGEHVVLQRCPLYQA